MGTGYILGTVQPVLPLRGIPLLLLSLSLSFKDFIYLFDRERDSEIGNISRRSGRGRSRPPAEQGAQCGARSQDPGIMT